MTDQTPRKIAEAYAETLKSQADDEEYETARERLDAYRERLERFEDSYGDSDPVTQELRGKVQSAETELSELEQKRHEPEELERKMLEMATGFMLDDEWLHPRVIEALNRALTGTAYPTLRVDDVEMAELEDAESLEDIVRYDIIDVVRKLARDKLNETDDLKNVWQSIEGTTKEEPFRIVAKKGGATTMDVANIIDEDIDRKVAENRLNNSVYQLDISPYHRQDGVFSLSTAGRYIAAKYAHLDDSDGGELTNKDASDDGQMRLGEESAVANGGDTDE